MASKNSALPVTRVLQRLLPIGNNYDVEPWGLRWRSNTIFIIVTIGVGMFSDLFLYSLIVPVIPFMLRDRVGTSPEMLQETTSFLVSVYAAASMILSPIAGYLSDTLANTRQVPFLLGLSALMGATVLLALAQSVPMLALARFLQGASSGVVWTVGLALCLETVGPENMGKTIGTIFSFLTAGPLLAPTLGGLLYEKTGYKGIFGVAVGILAVDLLLRLLVIEKRVAKRYLSANGSSSGTSSQSERDDTGTAEADEESSLLPKAPDDSFKIPTPTSRVVRAVPIIACLKNSSLVVACLLGFAQALLIASFDATVPIIAQDWYNFSALKAGLLFLPLGLVDIVSGPVTGWAIDRYGTKPAAVIGTAILGISFNLLRIPHAGGSDQIVIYCVVLAICGLGISIAGSPTIVEAGDIMEKYHKANPELFGKNGPYAQLYGMTSTLFSLGLTVGPIAAGFLKQRIGYANMNSIMGGFSFLMMILSAVYIGQPFPRWKKSQTPREEDQA